MKDIQLREVKSQFPLHLLAYAVASGFPVSLWIICLGHFGYYHRPGNPFWVDAILFGGSTIGIMAMVFLSLYVFATTDKGMAMKNWWLKATIKRELSNLIAPFWIAKLEQESKRELAGMYAKDLEKRGIKVEAKEIEEYVDGELEKKKTSLDFVS